jgi:hypothetical protein
MSAPRKFTIGTIAASTCLAVAALFEFLSAFTHLTEKIHFAPVAIIVLLSAFAVAAVIMWRGYWEAMRELETRVRQDQSVISLGKKRDESDVIEKLKARIKTGAVTEVDIGGLALRANFFKNHQEFGDDLLRVLRENKNVRVRIWLLDPRSSAHAIRMREMAEREKSDGLLKEACRESLETIRKIISSIWQEQHKRRPEVVLVDKVAITQFIFRVDEEMLVCFYLQHGTGNSSPTTYLKKGDRWFDVYKRQFELCFEMHADNLYPSEAELTDMLGTRLSL